MDVELPVPPISMMPPCADKTAAIQAIMAIAILLRVPAIVDVCIVFIPILIEIGAGPHSASADDTIYCCRLFTFLHDDVNAFYIIEC